VTFENAEELSFRSPALSARGIFCFAAGADQNAHCGKPFLQNVHPSNLKPSWSFVPFVVH
jgi:hypothetical protein